MKIYLIRHGKTEANERRCYCGSTDLSLSEAGRAEMEQLHYELPAVRFLTSGMKRADETLQILFGDVSFDVEPRFREVDFGIFEMHTYEELKDRADYQAWITGDNEANIPPQGESGRQMCQRVLEAFADLKEDTCIVTHGGVIAAIMQHLFPQEGKSRYQWQPQNGGGYLITDEGYQQLRSSKRERD